MDYTILSERMIAVSNGDTIVLSYPMTNEVRQAILLGSPVFSQQEALDLSSQRAYQGARWESILGRVNGGVLTTMYVIKNFATMNDGCPECGILGYERVNHLDVEHCDWCCGHSYCSYCAGYADTHCEYCERCDDHCSCVRAECGCTVYDMDDDVCSRCENCNSCCDCRRPVFVEGPHEPVFHTANSHIVNASSRYVAAEIELSAAVDYRAIADTVKTWRGAIVRDGSLPRGGIEINTAPANGDKFIEEIEHIGRTLDASDVEANADCGLHVHIDARDFEWADLRRLVLIYEKIEDTLFDMVPSRRRESSYCEPCADKLSYAVRNYHSARDIKMALVGGVYDMDVTIESNSLGGYGTYNERDVDRWIGEMKHDKYNHARYAALNLHSWFYRGTVECRLFNGTTNMNNVKHWAMMWAAILDFAKSSTDAQIEMLHVEGKQLLTAIVGSDDTRNWIEQRIERMATR